MYRTLLCNDIRDEHIGQTVQLAGWVDVIRDHGGVIFVDIRDYTGVTQTVIHNEELLKNVNRETVISVSGVVAKRDPETVNNKIATGYVELIVDELTVLGKSKNMLPFDVSASRASKDELRLKYRYLDLRNPKNHDNLVKRSKIIRHLRKKMEEKDFLEMQTPILTASSPEGARDFLVPSRKHPGKFYALPQAPQQFKQLLMVSGFDKYFQIAPCFRDEDARADRSPGEFYQLDFEMAFATQEEVLDICEDVVYDTFVTFSDKKVTPKPFRRITYADAMMTYGSDKPDLRNPLVICDLTDFFAGVAFPAFKGKPVRGIVADCRGKSKKFFEESLKYATSDEVGLGGLGYITLKEGVFAGPIAKFLSDAQKEEIISLTGVKEGETLFFICADRKNETEKKAGLIRTWLAKKEQLDLIRDDCFEFCFVVDFPMFEIDEETGDTIFTHNPFSMPQGGMDALLHKEPTEVLAYQYDLVCNGIELASGAVRNHDIDIMKKAFEIAGYDEEELKKRFNALYTAFQYGAPPHAGMAPGVDRMVMLLTDEEKILDVIAFPLNGNAQDLLLGAPSEVTSQQLEDVHLLGNNNLLAPRTAGGSSGRQQQGKRSTFANAQQLNQISLTDEEETAMQGIFDTMREKEEALKACDTEKVEEMVHVMPMTNVLREDVREQLFTREELLEGAPERSDDSWQVPRLVK
ncbi:MAG: aspartate--tRNA ligase [Clostridiaceae bacterium]|nr:aspartate--tRNA ligase [Clostridiaceae bacterium]